MKTSRIVVATVAIALLNAPPAFSAVPQSLVHHGFLTDETGIPLNGSVSFKFTLYNSADGLDKVWTEELTGWPVNNGYYSLTLGLATAFGDIFAKNSDLWLEISVGGQVLAPRQRVSAVPFAMVADDATGNIHPASITVNGTKIIDETGKWAGDPSWIPGIKSLTAGAPLTGGTITDSGTIGIAKGDAFTDGYIARDDWARFDAKQARVKGPCSVGYCVTGVELDGTPQCFPCGSGSAAVTLVDTGLGLKGGPITEEGTITVDWVYFDQWYVNAAGDTMAGALNINPVGGLIVGTDQLVCSADGNVGIGTGTPASKLDVRGGVNITGDLTLGGAVQGDLTIAGGGLKGVSSYDESDADSQTTATYATKVSLTLDAGTYVITATADVRNSTANYFVNYKLQNTTDNAVVSGPTTVAQVDALAASYTPIAIVRRVTLTDTKTIALQFQRGTSGTAYMKNARIFALRVD